MIYSLSRYFSHNTAAEAGRYRLIIEEGKLAASWLPSGRFFEMPQTKHPFEQVDLELLAGRLVDFFKN